MEGVFAYWLGWMVWIIVHFFLKDERLSLFILCLFVMIPLTFDLHGQAISFAYLFILCGLSLSIRNIPIVKLCIFFIKCLSVAGAYCALQLMIIYDPVIEYFDERLLSSGLIIFIVSFLSKQIKNRFVLASYGLVQGEFLTMFVVDLNLGNMAFFDKLTFICVFYLCVSLFISLLYSIESRLQAQKVQTKRVKPIILHKFDKNG